MRAFVTIVALPVALSLCACSGEEHSEPAATEETAAAREPAPALNAQEETVAIDPAPTRFEAGQPSGAISLPPAGALVPRPSEAHLGLPAGFRVQLYADGLEGADALTLSPERDVLVTASAPGLIHRLVDADHDGVAESREPFGDEDNGLVHPHGMVFAPGAVFVANGASVMRIAHPSGQRRLDGAGRRIAALPDRDGADRHALVLAGDRRNLHVSITGGPPSGPSEDELGSILELSLSGARRRIFASGLRDASAMAIQPSNGSLWATVVSEDGAPDFLTQIEDDAFYGWPAERTGAARAPDLLFAPGSHPRSIAVYGGSSFPERYRGGAFVCLAGAAKLVFIPFEDGSAADHYEDFVGGFVTDAGDQTWGRPNAVLVHPDGSVLFSDGAGRVFRVTWAG